MAAGLIADEYGYTWLMLFFLGWLFLSLTSTVCIWFCDCSTTGYLNMSISERQIFDDARLALILIKTYIQKVFPGFSSQYLYLKGIVDLFLGRLLKKRPLMYHNGNLSVKLINDQLLPWFSVEQMYKKMNEIFPSTDRK